MSVDNSFGDILYVAAATYGLCPTSFGLFYNLLSPERLVLDPEWQPFAYDAKGDAISFVHLPRETQRRLIFLDRRYVQDQPKTDPIAVRALPRELAHAQAGPLHFIFHTAFCCSTLLARAFDLPGASMGLKEPEIIGSFADGFETQNHSFDALSSLGLALDLLSRPLSPGEVQIVKPSNLANPIVSHLLDVRSDAKALIMHSSLETYLRATAQKSLMGRAFNRDALMLFHPVMPLSADLTDAVMMRLTDLEVAALVWLMQMRFLNDAAKRYGSYRIRTVMGTTLLSRPAETLSRAGSFFSVAAPADTSWEEVAAGAVFREHAKALGRPYSKEERVFDLETAGKAHAHEINAVMQWAEGIAGRAAAPMQLGDTLLNLPPQAPARPPGTAVPPAPPTPPRSS